MKIITYQAPDGGAINLTRAQIRRLTAAQEWPRNASGEYCSVSHGLHEGEPTCESNLVSDLVGGLTDEN